MMGKKVKQETIRVKGSAANGFMAGMLSTKRLEESLRESKDDTTPWMLAVKKELKNRKIGV